jgi:hypothetical protein
MSDSTPATEYTIPQPGPSAERDPRADEALSLLKASLRQRFMYRRNFSRVAGITALNFAFKKGFAQLQTSRSITVDVPKEEPVAAAQPSPVSHKPRGEIGRSMGARARELDLPLCIDMAGPVLGG